MLLRLSGASLKTAPQRIVIFGRSVAPAQRSTLRPEGQPRADLECFRLSVPRAHGVFPSAL